jgi:hypothetical protein
VIDILAHVSAWENEALTHLPHILEGKRPPKYSDRYGGIDAFNALKVRESRAVSPAEVLARCRGDPPRNSSPIWSRARGAIGHRDPLPPPHPAGHLQPLPDPHAGDPGVAGQRIGYLAVPIKRRSSKFHRVLAYNL